MDKIKEFRAHAARTLATGMGALLVALAPVTAFAEPPEIDCNSLSEQDMQKFYELSAQSASAAAEKNLNDALTYAKQAMALCTTDVYTEYTLGRIYQLSNDCPNAFYHFERLMNRPQSVQKDKENAEVYKELKKSFKDVKAKCGDVVTLEITCETQGTELTVTGLGSMTTVACPFLAKVKPGSYPIVAQKEGFQSRNDTVNVSASEGGSIRIPALKALDKTGEVRITCPRGASKFVLTSSDGTVDEYTCPWGGKLPADTYKIRLGGSGPEDDVELVVAQKGRVEYMIPNTAKANCSATPVSSSSSPLAAAVLALIGALGFGALRRRRAK